MLRNVEGRRFEDVTRPSGTGHFRKGLSVSFADWDCDGDLDFFVKTGGIVPGDKSQDLLFQNPGHTRHWLKVKLVGTRTNRSAVGARMQIDLTGTDGKPRSIYRTIGEGSGFGGNSLCATIGLGNVESVLRLTVRWPTSRMTQTFGNIAVDQAIEITEGSGSFGVLRQSPVTLPSIR